MFTQNYINVQDAFFRGLSYSKAGSLTDINGNEQTYEASKSVGESSVTTAMATPIVSTSADGMVFGTGSTPATKADYCLESMIASGLSFTKGMVLRDSPTTGKYVFQVSHALTNTTEAEINIWEIGLHGRAISSTSTVNYKEYTFLMERTVLTEPITIPPGESRTITYKITFNQTLNVD